MKPLKTTVIPYETVQMQAICCKLIHCAWIIFGFYRRSYFVTNSGLCYQFFPTAKHIRAGIVDKNPDHEELFEMVICTTSQTAVPHRSGWSVSITVELWFLLRGLFHFE